MSKDEVNTFLENKLNLQLGTIDEEGDPNIGPVWFNYDKSRTKLLIITPKTSRKVHNIRRKWNLLSRLS
jgi:general stress protein 26